jgi:hypothetical protein
MNYSTDLLFGRAFRKFEGSESRRKPVKDYCRRHGSGSRSQKTEFGRIAAERLAYRTWKEWRLSGSSTLQRVEILHRNEVGI